MPGKKLSQKKETIEKNKIVSEKPEGLEVKDTKDIEPRKIEKELYWFFGAMAGVFILFLIFYYFFQSLQKFNYEGIQFETIKEGDTIFYHTIVPLIKTSGEQVKYHFYFRTDPRKNRIPVNGEIEIPREFVVYISINETGLRQCEYSAVAIASLASFLRDAGGFEVEAAVPDERIATEINMPYVNCENTLVNPVILLQKNKETKITRVEGTSCYIVDVANCEILEAIEKFEIRAVLDARARSEKEKIGF